MLFFTGVAWGRLLFIAGLVEFEIANSLGQCPIGVTSLRLFTRPERQKSSLHTFRYFRRRLHEATSRC